MTTICRVVSGMGSWHKHGGHLVKTKEICINMDTGHWLIINQRIPSRVALGTSHPLPQDFYECNKIRLAHRALPALKSHDCI